MKFFKIAFTVTTISLLASCTAITVNKDATVIRDCTGTYLQFGGEDYGVCNAEILKNYNEGSKVTATFEIIKKCPEREGEIICAMYHKSAGMIRVKDVK